MSENENEIETIRRPKSSARRTNQTNAERDESGNGVNDDSEDSQTSRLTSRLSTEQTDLRPLLDDDLEFSLDFQARFFGQLLINPSNPSSYSNQTSNQPTTKPVVHNQANKSIIDLTKETNDDIQIICTTSPTVNRAKSKPNRVRNENASTSTNQNDDSPVLIQEIRADNSNTGQSGSRLLSRKKPRTISDTDSSILILDDDNAASTSQPSETRSSMIMSPPKRMRTHPIPGVSDLNTNKLPVLNSAFSANKTQVPVINPPPPVNLPTCPICMEDLEELKKHNKTLMATFCGHVFCNKCLDEHFKLTNQAKTMICPTCRGKLTKAKIHSLYL